MIALIDAHPHLGVEPVLRVLSIPSSTYYRWRRRERQPCERRRRDAELTEQIERIHADSGGIYGSPRVHAVLQREGVAIGLKRAEHLMREAGLHGLSASAGTARASPAATRRPRSRPTSCSATSPHPD